MKTTNKRGFSGLSDLVSEVDLRDEPQKQTNKVKASPPPPPQATPPQQKDTPPKSQASSAGSPRSADTAPSGSGSAGKLVLVGIGACFVLWLAVNGGQSNKTYSPPPAQKPQSYSAPQASPTPAVAPTPPRVPQNSGLQYTKPSVGTNNLLSVPEIQWCIRNGIRIDAMRNLIETNAGIDEFNRIVNDYNSRCGNYRYRQGTQAQAERSVEPYRSQIVAEAVREAKQLGRPYQPSSPSVSSASSTPAKPAESSAPEKPNAQYTREAQQLLTDLGYKPGSVDGDYGRRTADAVKAFQRDMGITQSGQIDESLLTALRRAKAENKPPVASQSQGQTNSPSGSNTAAGFFTRGSHQDDVLRVQGKPDKINDYSSGLGYMEWKYGRSDVRISSRSRTVLSWTNSGNLKVQFLPGKNTTNSAFFTRGSHQDDVLRVQGTPDAINDYSSGLGYEEWKYGRSDVKISSRSRTVLSWTNSGNLKVQFLPGKNTTNSAFFTRGSHQDDVLRVQGTPDAINDYSSGLGYEEWKYGRSDIRISSRDRRVISWNNTGGNLKAR